MPQPNAEHAPNADIVRACMESYIAQDRDTALRLIADDYAFTSPQDDHIGREAFFERCFPTTERLHWQKRQAGVTSE
jgi:hypothetical protein